MFAPEELLDIPQWPPWLLPVAIAVIVAAVGGALVLHLLRDKPEKVFAKPPRLERKTDKKNQRNFLRRGGNPLDVLISDEEAQAEPINALVIDRSMTGLGLAVSRSYEPGTVLSVRRTDNSTPWVRLEVKNCRLVAGTYEVGCLFVSIPPSSVLMMFG